MFTEKINCILKRLERLLPILRTFQGATVQISAEFQAAHEYLRPEEKRRKDLSRVYIYSPTKKEKRMNFAN